MESIISVLQNPIITGFVGSVISIGGSWLSFKFWVHRNMPEYKIWKDKIMARYKNDWTIRDTIKIPATEGRRDFKKLINRLHSEFSQPQKNDGSKEYYAGARSAVKEFETKYFENLSNYQPALDRFEALRRAVETLAVEMSKKETTKKIAKDQLKFNIILSKWRILFRICIGELYDEEEQELAELVIKKAARLNLQDLQVHQA